MKRILSLIILCSICLTYLYGCANSNTPMAVGKKIDKNLTNLYTAVSNLDTIDNSYIANPDIYQLENISNTNQNKQIIRTIAIPKTTDMEKEEFNIEDTINDDLVSADDDSLKNEEMTTDDSSKLESNNDDKNIEVVFEEDLNEDTPTTDVIIIDENGNGTVIDNNGEIDENQTISNDTLEQIYTDTVEDETLSIEEKNKVYQFLFENIRYTPRYVTDYNNINAQTSLNNYLYKVQELYTMTADVVEANNVLNNKKEILLGTIDNIKSYNNKMIDGEFVPNTQQLVALNNYAQDIKTTIKRIKDSNGQLNNEVNNISTSSSSYGLSKGVDIINSNYLKILNHIDVRITYFKSAMATLNQIEYIYKEAELDISYEDIELDNQSSEEEISTNHERKSNLDSYKNSDNFHRDSYQKITPTDDKISIENLDNNEIIENKKIDSSKNNENIDKNEDKLKYQNIDSYSGVVDNRNSVYDIYPSDNSEIINSGGQYNIENQNNQFHNLPNNLYDVNTPNGKFQNGIITQNNLNHGVNNGVNGMYSGLASSNGNVDYFKQNNMNRTDKNINTYGNNTLIDMINNGTVNNGINTLELNEVSTKPIMVDSDKLEESEQKNFLIESEITDSQELVIDNNYKKFPDVNDSIVDEICDKFIDKISE